MFVRGPATLQTYTGICPFTEGTFVYPAVALVRLVEFVTACCEAKKAQSPNDLTPVTNYNLWDIPGLDDFNPSRYSEQDFTPAYGSLIGRLRVQSGGNGRPRYKALDQLNLLLTLDRIDWWPEDLQRRSYRQERSLAMMLRGKMPFPWRIERMVRDRYPLFYVAVMNRMANRANDLNASYVASSLINTCSWMKPLVYGPLSRLLSVEESNFSLQAKELYTLNQRHFRGTDSAFINRTYEYALASGKANDDPVAVNEQTAQALRAVENNVRGVLRAAPKEPRTHIIDYLLSEVARRGLSNVWELPGLSELRPRASTSGDTNTYNFNNNLRNLGNRKMLEVAIEQQKLGWSKLFTGDRNKSLPGVNDLVNENCPLSTGCWNTNTFSWDSHYSAAASYLALTYPDHNVWYGLYAAEAQADYEKQRLVDEEPWLTSEQVETRINDMSLQADSGVTLDSQIVQQADTKPTPYDREQDSIASYLAMEAKRKLSAPWELEGLGDLKPPTNHDWGQALYALGQRDPELFINVMDELSRLPYEAAHRNSSKIPNFNKLVRALPGIVWVHRAQILRWFYGMPPERQMSAAAPNLLPVWLLLYNQEANLREADKQLLEQLEKGEISEDDYNNKLKEVREKATNEIVDVVDNDVKERRRQFMSSTREHVKKSLDELSSSPLGAFAQLGMGLGFGEDIASQNEQCQKIAGFLPNIFCEWSKPISFIGGALGALVAGKLMQFVPDGGMKAVKLAKLSAMTTGTLASYYLTRRMTGGKERANKDVQFLMKGAMLLGGGTVGLILLIHWNKIRMEMDNVRELLETTGDPKHPEGETPKTWPPDEEVAGQLGNSLGRIAGLLWLPATMGNWSDDNFIDKAWNMVEAEALKYGRSLKLLPGSAQDTMMTKAHDTMIQVRQSRDEMSALERLVSA